MYTHAAGATPYRNAPPLHLTVAAGREYRIFCAWALRPGNERGCVEPPELERSPQLVTAGRDVRRWCLHTRGEGVGARGEDNGGGHTK